MKKFFIIALILLLIGSSALAVTFTNLRDVQDYIDTHSAYSMGPYPPDVSLMGYIVSIQHLTSNQYFMLVEVNDERAHKSIGFDLPIFTASFHLHLDEMPFEIGQQVLIVGSINSRYSSPLIPNIIIEEINGLEYDEF